MILKSTTNIEKSTKYGFFRSWFGQGIGVSAGDRWRRDRKLLNPLFHPKIIQDMVPNINENARQLVKSLEQESMQIKNLAEIVCSKTLNVMLDLAFGANCEDFKNFEYRKLGKAYLTLAARRMLSPLWQMTSSTRPATAANLPNS